MTVSPSGSILTSQPAWSATHTAPCTVARRQRVTRISNETEADPPLGGAFIGDYLEVTANRGRARVHYNANERQVALLGEGQPIPQQDNYLTRVNP